MNSKYWVKLIYFCFHFNCEILFLFLRNFFLFLIIIVFLLSLLLKSFRVNFRTVKTTISLSEYWSNKNYAESFIHLFGSSFQSFNKSSVSFTVTINQIWRNSGSTCHATPGVWQVGNSMSVHSSWNETNK